MNQDWMHKLLLEIERYPLVERVSDLIRTPSVNPKDREDCERWGIQPGEAALVERLQDHLRHTGLEISLQEIVPGRANLIARYSGSQPGAILAFNAHLDTVGAYEMGERAFQPVVQDGRLYGRGAADMKGALGCFVAALEILAKVNPPLRGQVLLTAVIGEEGPPSGTKYLLQHGFHADGVIVGEASECRLFIGQRGGQFVRLKTTGRSGHGSMPDSGVNAIQHMVRLLASIQEMTLFKREEAPYGSPTCSIGTVRGGVRTNVIPEECEATLDVRLPPGILPSEVLEAFSEQMRTMGISGEVSPEEPGYPASLTEPSTHIVRVTSEAMRSLGLPETLGLAPYWTDLYHLNQAGVPSVILGPGSILRAHSGNEYVEIEQLYLATKIYALTALIFCGLSL